MLTLNEFKTSGSQSRSNMQLTHTTYNLCVMWKRETSRADTLRVDFSDISLFPGSYDLLYIHFIKDRAARTSTHLICVMFFAT